MAKWWQSVTATPAEEQKAREERDELRRRRKATLRSMEARFPGQPMEWKDGTLVFSTSKQPVPDAPIIAKSKPEVRPELIQEPRLDPAWQPSY